MQGKAVSGRGAGSTSGFQPGVGTALCRVHGSTRQHRYFLLADIVHFLSSKAGALKVAECSFQHKSASNIASSLERCIAVIVGVTVQLSRAATLIKQVNVEARASLMDRLDMVEAQLQPVMQKAKKAFGKVRRQYLTVPVMPCIRKPEVECPEVNAIWFLRINIIPILDQISFTPPGILTLGQLLNDNKLT